MNKMLKVILPVLLISVLLIAGCSNESEAPPEEEDIQAPDFQLDTLDGQTVALSDFRGEVVLLNFWATWCGPCASEMPFIQQVYDEWSGKGLRVLAINIGESAGTVTSFLEEYSLSFPVLLDIDGAVATQYGATNIPTTFLIDQEGIVQGVKVGAFSSVEEIEGGISLFIPE
jgi:peroxiredoxin